MAQAPALEGLKKNYEEEIAKTVTPLREGYRKALLSLEQQLAAKGDYAGAKKVQEERREIDRLTGRSAVAPPALDGVAMDPEGIPLRTHGEGAGGLKLVNEAWVSWTQAGATIRWALPPGLPAGGYTVELAYHSDTSGSVPLLISEDFHTLTRVAKVEASTGSDGDGSMKRIRPGTLRLKSGATRLELKLTAPATAAAFRLYELRLIPEDSNL